MNSLLSTKTETLKPLATQQNKLQKAVVWAAECTGNDFQLFAGLLRAESNICLKRHNRGGGDSGCGQFTGAAIRSFKNQMRLAGRKESGSAFAKQAFDDMAKKCFSRRHYVHAVPGSYNNNQRPTYETFVQLMGSSHGTIKTHFRRGSAMHIDLVATAMFLKFNAAKAGGYVVPGRRKGGLARYNGGGVRNYANKVLNHSKRVSLQCFEDTYSSNVLLNSCEFDENPEDCIQDFIESYEAEPEVETWEI